MFSQITPNTHSVSICNSIYKEQSFKLRMDIVLCIAFLISINARSIGSTTTEIPWRSTTPEPTKLDYCPEVTNMDESEDETTNSVNIIWPKTKINMLAVSEPNCLDENGDLKTHFCTELGWDMDDLNCEYFTSNNSTNCPDHYSAFNLDPGNKQCIMLTDEKTKYSNLCKSANIDREIFESSKRSKLVDYLKKMHPATTDVWLTDQNIPGELKTSFNVSKSVNTIQLEYFENCFSLNLKDESISLRNCKEELQILCIAELNKIVIKSACPEDHYAYRYDDNSDYCFTIKQLPEAMHSIPSSITRAELFEPVTLKSINIYKQLVNEYAANGTGNCLVNLEKLKIDGFRVNQDIGTIEKNGKASTLEKEYNCIAKVVKNEKMQIPKMYLRFDESANKLLLIGHSVEYLFRTGDDPIDGIKCYTNFIQWILSLVEVSKDKIESPILNADYYWRTTYSVELISAFPKYYWCEGYSINSSILIKTDRIIAQNKNNKHIYAMRVTLPVSEEKLNKMLYEGDRKAITAENLELVLHDYDVYKIESYDKSTEKMTLLIHIAHEDENLKNVKKSLESSVGYPFTINSTESCDFEDLDENLKRDKFKLKTTKIGHKTATDVDCLDEDGLPYTVGCVGDVIYGGVWEDVKDAKTFDCSPTKQITEITKELSSFEMVSNDINATFDPLIIEKIDNITVNVKELRPVNFIQLTHSMHKQFELLRNTTLTKTTTDSLTNILSNIMDTNIETITKVAETGLNTTNILLETLDTVFDNYATQGDDDFLDENGINLKRTSNLIVFTVDPLINNYSGMALYIDKKKNNCEDKYNNFDNYLLHKIKWDASLEDVALDNSVDYQLEIATYLPKAIFDLLKQASSPGTSIRIVIKVCYNAVLFPTSEPVIVEKVLSMTLPGLPSSLPGIVPIYIATGGNREQTYQTSCNYWNFKSTSKNALGNWLEHGCTPLALSNQPKELTVCGCDHLTHFSLLLTGEDKMNEISETVNLILTTLTHILSILSMIGLSLLIITFITFKRCRSDLNKLILVNFSFAIALQLLFVLIIDYTKDAQAESGVCIWMGALLQFFTLSTFTWMLVLAIRQYIVFVKIFASDVTEHFYRISVIGCWGFPMVTSGLTVAIFPGMYKRNCNDLCYPKGIALTFGVLLPIISILITNLLLFIAVLRNVFKKVEIKSTMKQSNMPQLKLAMTMFFTLGFTWIFGLIINVTDGIIKIIFIYLFTIFGPTQGFVMFIFNVILNKPVRGMWMNRINLKDIRDPYSQKVSFTTKRTLLKSSVAGQENSRN